MEGAGVKVLLHIVRGNVELGILPEKEVRELLCLGFLTPTDVYRIDGMENWKPLSELPAGSLREKPASTVLRTAGRSVATMGNAIAGSAQQLGATLKSLTQKKTLNLRAAITTKALEGYLPQIQTILLRLLDTKAFQAFRAGVQDDGTMRKIFGATYDCLPKPEIGRASCRERV